MAYKCSKYNKILVGPKLKCEGCKEPGKSGLESKCQYKVWQEGVLKEGGKRTRGKWRYISPRGVEGPTFQYALYEEDGAYHYVGGNRKDSSIPILEILTPNDMMLVKKNRDNYFELLRQKGMY